MSGFVAIVSTAPRGSVDQHDIDALADAYEALRGAGTRSSATVGTWTRAIKIDTPAAEARGVEHAGSGWSIHAGAAYGPRPLASADVAELEGQFALLRRPPGRDEVELFVDPFGMQPTFVAERGEIVYLSTSAMALARYLRARAGREPTEVFLRAGMQFGSPTLWPEIRRLEPAARIRLGPGRCEEDVYWRPQVDRAVTALSFERAVDHVIEVTTATWSAYRDRPTGWTDLTGGFDTRLMNVLLQSAGVEFEAQTRETRNVADARIAREVAAHAHWPWRLFRLPDTWPKELPPLVPTALGWSEGQLDALHLARNLWGHRLASERHRSLFVGIGGDHMRGHAWRQELYREGRSNRVNYDNLLDMRLLHPLDVSIFAADPTAAVRSTLRRRVESRAAPYRDELNTVQLDAIHAFKMTGHAGAFCAADGAFLRSQLPFYLRPVFGAAFSTDFRHRNNHRLMRAMIERLNPAAAAVATETGGPAQSWRPGNLHRFVPYYAKLARKAVNKVSYRAVGREILPVRLPIDPRMTTALSGYVRSLDLRRGAMRSGALYSPVLDGFLADAAAGRFRDLDLLGRIVTVELALRAADSELER